MNLQQASRKRVKIKCALQGPSSSGKTKSALYIAYGLCGDWSKIAVIDTENRSSELYSDVGQFQVLHLTPPFSPERYTEAVNTCIQAGVSVIIIDSLTHEWEYILEAHGNMLGNSFTNWAKFTPRHNAFVNTVLQADVHIIGTIRTKQDYVLSQKNGKYIPEKVGLKGVQRDGIDYEFTLVFDLDISLHAKASKDRTQLFFNQAPFIPSIETGKKILQWCNEGDSSVPGIPIEEIKQSIRSCKSLEELNSLFVSVPQHQQALKSDFSMRKQQLTQLNHPNNFSNNGTYSNK